MNKVKYVVMALLAIVFFFPHAYASANTPTLYVNNKAVPANEGVPYVKNQSTYIPIAAIAKRMGDQVSFDKKDLTLVVKQKNRKVIEFQAGRNYAMINGKAEYLVWKTEKGVKYPTSHIAQLKNNVFYVPAAFVRDVMKYPLVVKNVNGKRVVYVGQLPKETKKPTKPTKPTTDPDEKAKQEFLSSWTPPKIKSKMTNDPVKNMEILERELGLYVLGRDVRGCAAKFNPFSQSDGPWSFGVSECTGIDGVDLEIVIKVWGGDRWNPEFYKTPYILEQVFKFYELPQVYDILYRGIEKDENVDDKVGKWLTFGKRKVLIRDGKQVIIQVKNLYQR